MKKRYRSRKKKALLRGLLLVVLVTVLSLTNAVSFLPQQAAYRIAEIQNVAQPRILRSFYDHKLKVYRFARQYLMEGEEALILCAVGWDPFSGWYDRDWSAVRTQDGNGFHVGYRGHQQGNAYSGYFYGRLDDERMSLVKLRWKDAEKERWYEEELYEDAFFQGGNGKRYLLKESSFGAEDTRWFQHMTAYAYDETGVLLAEEKVFWQEWGSAG